MSNTRSAPSNPSGFFRRLLGCVLFVLGIAGFFALIQRFQENLSRGQMSLFAILAVGLAAGSATRSSFYERSGWLRFMVVLVILPIGMFALGYFTNWQIGVGPLEPWLAGKIDMEQILQLGGALFVSVITLAAWRRSQPKIQPEASISRQISNRTQVDRTPSPAQPVRNIRFSHGRSSGSTRTLGRTSWFPKIKGFQKFNWDKKKRDDKLVLSSSASSGRARSGFQRRFRRKPNVNLALVEIHRCPYCLEEVKLNDPRGTRKCEICNTLHHADCWEVTGECQIPHLTTL